MRRRAFSLIELVVVLVLIGLLAVIAYVTYSKASAHANNGNAAGQLHRVVSAELAFAGAYGQYASYPGDLSGNGVGGHGLTIVTTPQISTGPTVVSVAVGADGTLGVAVRATTGLCILERISSPANGASASAPTLPPTQPCDGQGALAAGDAAQTPTSLRG